MRVFLRNPLRKGMTLLEIVMMLALLAIVFAVSAPLYFSSVSKNNLAIAKNTITNSLREAESYARAQKQDSNWGVHITNTAVTVFQGNLFSSRVETSDDIVSLPSNVTIEGLTDIIFEKMNGTPLQTGTITIKSPNQKDQTITINAKGMIDFS